MARRRRIGQETEYAVRRPNSSPQPGEDDRHNHSLFLLIRSYISERTCVLPGYRDFFQSQFFLENGSAFAYESIPTAEKDGLIEGATPECENAYELLCYQRAQEAWLKQALQSQRITNDSAFQGCGLLKNCRDAEGHIYGSQENYETVIAKGFSLYLYRALIGLAVPVTFLGTIAMLGLLLAALFAVGLFVLLSSGIDLVFRLLAKAFPIFPITQVSHRMGQQHRSLLQGVRKINDEQGAKLANATLYPLLLTLLSPFAWLISQLSFRSVRRCTTAFLTSRVIFTGAGCLLEEDDFVLSEKTSALKSSIRLWATMSSRSLFDTGNLLKGIHLAALDCFILRHTNWLFLFAQRQRLQIGCSDANRCDVAEYLKLGTTQLVIEMAEEGFLDEAPQLKSPVSAMTHFNRDLKLSQTMPTKKHGRLSAIEIQNWYLQRAAQFIADAPERKAIYQPVFDRWRQVLETLAWDPEQLIGQIDWITKKSLLDGCESCDAFAVKKRIDLNYHELGSGYFERVEQAGLAPRIVPPQEIEAAMIQPPAPRSAKRRSRFIRVNQDDTHSWVVGWNFALRGIFRNQSRRPFDRAF